MYSSKKIIRYVGQGDGLWNNLRYSSALFQNHIFERQQYGETLSKSAADSVAISHIVFCPSKTLEHAMQPLEDFAADGDISSDSSPQQAPVLLVVAPSNADGFSKNSLRVAVEKFNQSKQGIFSSIRFVWYYELIGKWLSGIESTETNLILQHVASGLDVIETKGRAVNLTYVDDLIFTIREICDDKIHDMETIVNPCYHTATDEILNKAYAFKNSQRDLKLFKTGRGLERALYATFLSYLPTEEFAYELKAHTDNRGKFVEIAKTDAVGQFSFFVAKAGEVRGQHFHNTKNEKFLVVKGSALFRFRDLVRNEIVERLVSADDNMVVVTIPGWAHEIVNTGEDELVVFIWANEVFDLQKPDTFRCEV